MSGGSVKFLKIGGSKLGPGQHTWFDKCLPDGTYGGQTIVQYGTEIPVDEIGGHIRVVAVDADGKAMKDEHGNVIVVEEFDANGAGYYVDKGMAKYVTNEAPAVAGGGKE